MPTPADELRTAAATLRALAEAAATESGNPHWTSTRAFPEQPDSTASIVSAEEAGPVFRIARASYVRGPISDYVAAMDPAIGLLLAKWLGSWDGVDFDEHASMPDDLAHALTIARAINASQP